MFEIGDDAYDDVFAKTSKAFYYLRCGCGLDERYAGVWHHGRCHTGPAKLWDDRSVTLDVTGGWHDAGDYGRYVTAGACAAAHLLYAYKLFPEAFEKQKLGIPENGMPDILSEVRYELEWLLKMQDSEGGAYHKATTAMHAPFVMPEDDTEDMFVFPVSSMATADLAAVCALASGIYNVYDKAFAEKLLRTAEKGGSTGIRSSSGSSIPRAAIPAATVSGTIIPTASGHIRRCMRLRETLNIMTVSFRR